MGDLFGKVIDWVKRLWWLIGVAPSAWAYWEARTAGVPTHEVIFITVGTLALAMNVLFVAHRLLAWWQEKRAKMGVVGYLRARQEAGDATVLLAHVTTAWHGNDGRASVVALGFWNAKFRRLKRAVENGEIKGKLHPAMQSEADVDDLIRYFSSWVD